MRVLGVYTQPKDALRALEQYKKETGFYAKARIVQLPGKDNEGGGWAIEVLAFDEPCIFERKYVLSHTDCYIALMLYERTRRDAQRHKLLRYLTTNQYVLDMLMNALKMKNTMRQMIEALVKDTKVAEFARLVKAARNSTLGPVFSLYILGNIDPHIATSAGRAKAILGFTPEGKPRAGKKAKGRIQFKGPIYFAAARVLGGSDTYYVPLAQAKIDYYMNVRKIDKGEARRRATFWLASLLISHAAELLRADEGLDVSAYRSHTPYIPPKSHPNQVPDEELLQAIRQGKT